MMSREQVSLGELVLSLDSSELQEAEQVRTEINQQLSTDRGGTVLSSLVEHYLETWSSQVVLVLSSIRESHHKLLLEKLNESLNRPGTRIAGLALLGHLIRKQPPWVHHISRSALLPSLLRCLKTDTDVVVLITGVLVLITLLPMIPQAGKQHIYDFFDVFGRLASWSYKNPSHVSEVHLVHLHAGVYSLFHRLYGMFPCNFISYLRLHYSMKENLDTFQEVIKPMLEHVRVHPELVTGTQDCELDPSRWRCYEVHDIMIECSRVCLDPLESSCEEDIYFSPKNLPPSSSLCSPRPPSASSILPYLDLPSSPQTSETIGSSGGLVFPSQSGRPILTQNSSFIQANGLIWSPSCQCGMSTPPPEPAAAAHSTHTLSRTTSSSAKCPSSASTPVTTLTEDSPGGGTGQGKLQPITEEEERGQTDIITSSCEGMRLNDCQQLGSTQSVLTSTPGRDYSSSGSVLLPPPSFFSLCFTPPHPSSSASHRSVDQYQSHPYESLFELALPQAATLFIRRKTQELLEKTGGGHEDERVEDLTSMSPLKVLDQMIVHGHVAHEQLSWRSSVVKSVDLSNVGGKQQSMKNKGPTLADELHSMRSQLLLVHGQLQYERFKRQQHAIRNRRLLRRVINTMALEEQSVAMKAQLGVQDQEIQSLKSSLQTEQGQYTKLQQDTDKHSKELQTYIQQLLLQVQDEQRRNQRLQGELQECQSGLRNLEVELQRANNQAYNSEHQLTQLSLKLCSSEQLQQQIFVLNQQLVLLREANRALTEQLDGGDDHCTEASMLQCSVNKDYQHLKDSEVLHRQKLEAANHRITELENQVAKKDRLILDQKKLLDDTKTQSRAELLACECRCLALRRVTQSLQTEILHLYSQVCLDTHGRPQDVCTRSNADGSISPVIQGSHELNLHSSSSAGLINGEVEALSSSPIKSPLAIGSFLEQRSWQLFRATNRSQNEEKTEQEEKKEQEEAKPQSPSPSQEVEEATLNTGSPDAEHPNQTPDPPLPASEPLTRHADLNLDVRQRRCELSIMDYDETLPEN